jgi:outer membrane receptor protein involved in Fe transport
MKNAVVVWGIVRQIALSLTVIATVALPLTPTVAQSSEPIDFDIPPQDLGAALNAYARQAGTEIAFTPDVVKGKELTSAVKGQYRPDAALAMILDGTGLEYRLADSSILVVSVPQPDEKQHEEAERPSVPAQETDGNPRDLQAVPADNEISQRRSVVLEEVTVVGTRIKGAPPASAVITITQDQMRLSGQNNLGEVMRALPQNFAGGQNPGVAFDATAGGASNQNITGSSAVNLRGLGHDATLTLLNGTRLPYDGLTQATDVSVVPVAAIERVEILLDGASAIYGSDAVGGVVNMVLKRDFEGAEFSARYGVATDGGFEQRQYTGVAGQAWESGGFLFTGDHSRNSDINAKDRDYLAHLPNQTVDIYPSSLQKGALFSGHQDIGGALEFTIDGFYTERQQETLGQATTASVRDRDSRIWGMTPGLRFDLPADWSLRLFGSFGRNDSTLHQTDFSVDAGQLISQTRISYLNRARSAGAEVEGALLSLPGGEARLSAGAGYRKNSFARADRLSEVTTTAGESLTHYGYGEINVPLVSEAQEIPLVSSLTMNGAVRYEDSSAFGDSLTPKFGLIWSMTPSLDVKANWGESFKAPTLLEQYQSTELYLYPGAFFGAPAGSTVLLTFGGNPALGPERAEILTAGLVATPDFFRGFSLEFNWFDIDYDDRVVIPITVADQALTNPAYGEFVTLTPSEEQQRSTFAEVGLPYGEFTGNFSGQAYDPADVHSIVQDKRVNAASQQLRGVDLSARYVMEAFGGNLSLNANMNWITDSTRTLSSLAPPLPTAGVIYFPSDFKARLEGTWSRDSFTGSAVVSRIAGVTNTSAFPNVKGGSMTTIDLVFDYEWQSTLFGELGFNVAATNLLNEAPPYLEPAQPYSVNYDSTNYSAIGRMISGTVRKRF